MNDAALGERLRSKSLVYTLTKLRLVTLPAAMSGKDRGELYIRVRQPYANAEASWSSKGAVDEVWTDQLQLTEVDRMGPPPPPRSVYRQPIKVPLAGPEILNSEGKVVGRRATVPVVDFTEECSMPMSSDVKVEVIHKAGRHDEKLFSFWFHPAMLTGDRLVLRKWQLDGANKDKKHKKYNPHFRVECTFREGTPSGEACGAAAPAQAMSGSATKLVAPSPKRG